MANGRETMRASKTYLNTPNKRRKNPFRCSFLGCCAGGCGGRDGGVRPVLPRGAAPTAASDTCPSDPGRARNHPRTKPAWRARWFPIRRRWSRLAGRRRAAGRRPRVAYHDVNLRPLHRAVGRGGHSGLRIDIDGNHAIRGLEWFGVAILAYASARFMNSVQMGAAESAPWRSSSLLSSNPTHTTHSSSEV